MLFLIFWITFTIIILNFFSGRLPISFHLFGLVGFYLALSSVTYFFVISLLLMGGAALQVAWPEVSSTGVCRHLVGARSWCWVKDLCETSHWFIFPGTWSSLLFQCLVLSNTTPTFLLPVTGVQVQCLACEPQLRNPCGAAKTATTTTKKKQQQGSEEKEQKELKKIKIYIRKNNNKNETAVTKENHNSKKFIIYMETKETWNCQSKLKKEEKSCRNQSVSTTSDYTTKLY